MRTLELFAGAGGFALSSKRSGSLATSLIERDQLACSTLVANRKLLGLNNEDQVVNMALEVGSEHLIHDQFEILLGGPPCQPFSMGGQRHGHKDERDMFPVFTKFVHHFKPKAFIIENVAGLRSGKCLKYFAEIIGKLSSNSRRQGNIDLDLKRGEPILKSYRPDYKIHFGVLNAADYGVAQNRSRMFIVGIQADLYSSWQWPSATHSWEALKYSQYISKEYFRQYDLPATRLSAEKLNALTKRLNASEVLINLKPHRTVRDAISDLPDPRTDEAKEFLNHVFIPGARSYAGHSGSEWDNPSKTIKAGVHGCPGGENTLRLNSGRVRYFTVRELARIQGFPDSYQFLGTRNQCVKQIGNAVPVGLGSAVIKQVLITLGNKPALGRSSPVGQPSRRLLEN
jgi:DNA (cytosine-5)-methyltransferase 1